MAVFACRVTVAEAVRLNVNIEKTVILVAAPKSKTIFSDALPVVLQSLLTWSWRTLAGTRSVLACELPVTVAASHVSRL